MEPRVAHWRFGVHDLADEMGVSYWSQDGTGSLQTDFQLNAEGARTYASYM